MIETTLLDFVERIGVPMFFVVAMIGVVWAIIHFTGKSFSAQITSLGAAHNAQVTSLSESVRTLNKSADKGDTERHELLKRIQDLENSRRETDQSLSKAREDNALLKVEVKQQADKIKTLELRIEEQIASIDVLRAELKEARQGAGVSDKQSIDLRAENVKLETANAVLKAQVEELQRDNRVIRGAPPIGNEGDKGTG